MRNNIILIGLPGSGKSTLGVRLAKHLTYHFIDTDILIQSQQGRTLQQIVDTEGYLTLRRAEEQALLSLDTQKTVIATGGSAVYSDKAMRHLKDLGKIVYLHASIETVTGRIDNEATRGIARPPDQTLAQVFVERLPLYQHYADITIDNETMAAMDTISDLIFT
ncbi:MAG: shikimate kinase [Cellvibrionaceae bacterium]|nr:shikimate kinase [Cellvibrionaceae bacterium]